MRHILPHLLLLSLVVLIASCVATQTARQMDIESVDADGVPRISVQELKEVLGSPEVVLIDTRATQQWKVSSEKIPGAVHHSSFEADEWSRAYNTNATMVLYCA